MKLMKKIDEISIEIKKDLTQFHGLVRKLVHHGFSKDLIKIMVGNCFRYNVVKNNLAHDIHIWHKKRVGEILSMNPHLGKEK